MEEVVAEEVIVEEKPVVQEETPETAEEPGEVEETPVEEVETTEEAVEEVEEPKPLWQDRELKNQYRKLQEAKRELAEEKNKREAAEALAAKFNQGKPQTVPDGYVPQSEVRRLAAEERLRDKYVEDCNKAAQKGEEAYKGGWKEAVGNLEVLGGFDQETMNGVLASDDPAKVLYEIGKNPDQYHRIMELPLARRIIEIGKLAMVPVTPKKVSEAPAPVRPVGGTAATSKAEPNDKMSDDEWYAAAKAQRAKRFAARR